MFFFYIILVFEKEYYKIVFNSGKDIFLRFIFLFLFVFLFNFVEKSRYRYV